MMKRIWPAALAALVLLGIDGTASAQGSVAEPMPMAALDPAYLSDLRQVMEGAQLPTLLKLRDPAYAKLNGAMRDFDDAFRAQITAEETYRRMAPVLARHMDPAQAARFAELYRSPAIRKRELAGAHRLSGLGTVGVALSAAEQAELTRLDATPAAKSLRSVMRKVIKDVSAELVVWMRDFDKQLAVVMRAVLLKVHADLAAPRTGTAGRVIQIGKVGVRFLDQTAYVVGSALIKTTNASRSFGDKIESMGFPDIQKPQFLASKHSVARFQAMVEQAEVELNTMLKDVDQIAQEREVELGKIEFPPGGAFQKMAEGLTMRSYTGTVEFGEATRRLLDEYRRLLAFISARQEKVVYEDGRLLFADDADLAAVKIIFSNLNAAMMALQEVDDKHSKDVRDAQQAQAAGKEGMN